TLTATGSTTTITAMGTTTIDGANLYAQSGAHLSLPKATSYGHAATSSNQVRTLEAAGAGSVLDLSGLTSITNGTEYGSQIHAEALGGGLIDLGSVTQIADGTGGDYRARAIVVSANGSGGGTGSTV